jgi:hypothetical protein
MATLPVGVHKPDSHMMPLPKRGVMAFTRCVA